MPDIEQFSIYWFDPGQTQGSELSKIRPCVVISPIEMNQPLKTVLVAPLTSTIKAWPFRLNVKVMGRLSSISAELRTVFNGWFISIGEITTHGRILLSSDP